MELLRYRISSWKQLKDCLSNNSRELHISVSEFPNNDDIDGIKISVQHIEYGTLFCYVIGAHGNIVTGDFELTTPEVLKCLETYGFLIEYAPEFALSASQKDYLRAVNQLGYDKLRKISVEGFSKPVLVVFDIAKLPKWIDNLHRASQKEYSDAVLTGAAVNISNMIHEDGYVWDWLTYVADIQQVLDNQPEE